MRIVYPLLCKELSPKRSTSQVNTHTGVNNGVQRGGALWASFPGRTTAPHGVFERGQLLPVGCVEYLLLLEAAQVEDKNMIVRKGNI